ncbi:TetR/AcrR family transcriptional regulator [Nocardioides pantholopis]|uniref:TetR/AcrR family transcriptional regulator n=1 Tax=Nocardioides pantholopis TaxID=2483798 RepID=UPI000FD8DA42|nr:TetR/AcrR family transcriptional regulator [Nocardioides pantholopis]
MSAADTRELLIDAALRAFAEHGIHNASLLEITRMAGQRNRGAVHYHFGSRERLLLATLEAPAAILGTRERELLARAQEHSEDDVAPVLEAVIRPVVELSENGWRGRCYLKILAEVAYEARTTMSAPVAALIAETGGYEVLEVLSRRLPPMDDAVRDERFALLARFVLDSAADRVPADGSAPGMGIDRFIANLVSMASAMLTAPVPD